MKKLFAAALAVLFLLPVVTPAQEAWQRPWNKDQGASYVAFGRYPHLADGTEAPIVWRVLETVDGVVYLMSEYILDVSKLHHDAERYPGWDKADLNAWLQTDFVEKAFDEGEAAALSETAEGIVSLPSSDDLKNKAFGLGTDLTRRTIGTPWADAQGLFFYRHKKHSPYWTRTPSDRPHAHRTIKLEGNLGYLGVTNSDMGIRPVIWLQADMVEVSGGSGTLADPYVLVVRPE